MCQAYNEPGVSPRDVQAVTIKSTLGMDHDSISLANLGRSQGKGSVPCVEASDS